MGRAADEPEVLLQPYELLELFPLLAQLRERCDELAVRMLPGNNVGYFGPHEAALRSYMPAAHAGSCGAGSMTLGIEADGTIKGCPSLPTAGLERRQHPRPLATRHLGARRTAALHARSHGRRSLGLLPHLLLRRRLPRGLHLDQRRVLRHDRATTRTATIARSSLHATASASAWCSRSCRRALRSTTDASN